MIKLVLSLFKAIPNTIYSCLKATTLILVCALITVKLATFIAELPPVPVSSYQVEPNLPQLQLSPKYDYKRSVVRLFRDGEFFCSGVVIGGNYVLTAAHCLVNNDGVMIKHPVLVKNDDGTEVVMAAPAGVNTRMDHGLIIGDFRNIPGAITMTDHLRIPPAVIACGYPLGSSTMDCSILVPVINDAFLIKCSGGPLIPGQSGGPVFDAQGRIVGLNVQVYSAYEGGGSAYATVVGILSEFHVGN
jgi:S1-C subfamily serine protease